jgi:transcriptional regulator with XRE-family HTH domain
MKLAKRLEDWRLAKGYSLRKAGAVLGVTGRGYHLWELGRAIPRGDRMGAIAKALKISARELSKLCAPDDDESQ